MGRRKRGIVLRIYGSCARSTSAGIIHAVGLLSNQSLIKRSAG